MARSTVCEERSPGTSRIRRDRSEQQHGDRRDQHDDECDEELPARVVDAHRPQPRRRAPRPQARSCRRIVAMAANRVGDGGTSGSACSRRRIAGLRRAASSVREASSTSSSSVVASVRRGAGGGTASACDPELDRAAPRPPLRRPDPDGFMSRDDIVAYLERYATSAAVPIRETSRCRRWSRSARAGTSRERAQTTIRPTASCSRTVPTSARTARRWCRRASEELPADRRHRVSQRR